MKQIILGMLWFDKRVMKRYFGIETPLYKRWWKIHCEEMQLQLDLTNIGAIL